MRKNVTSRISLCLTVGVCAMLTSCSMFHKGPKLYAEDIPPKAVVRDGVAVTLSDQKLTLFKEASPTRNSTAARHIRRIGAAVPSTISGKWS